MRLVKERKAKFPQHQVPIREILVFDLAKPRGTIPVQVALEHVARYQLVSHSDLDAETIMRPHIIQYRIVQDKQLFVEVYRSLLVDWFKIDGNTVADKCQRACDCPSPTDFI